MARDTENSDLTLEVNFSVVILVDMLVDSLDVLVAQAVSHPLESRSQFRSKKESEYGVLRLFHWDSKNRKDFERCLQSI